MLSKHVYKNEHFATSFELLLFRVFNYICDKKLDSKLFLDLIRQLQASGWPNPNVGVEPFRSH